MQTTWKRAASTVTSLALTAALAMPATALALEPADIDVGKTPIATAAVTAADFKSELEAALKAKLDDWGGASQLETGEIAAPADMSLDDAADIALTYIRQHPQYFYLKSAASASGPTDGAIMASMRQDAAGKYVNVTLNFDNETFTPEHIEEFNTCINRVFNGMDPSWNDEQKALYLHDYIVTHCKYDMSNEKYMYTAFGAALGKAVCQGYCGLYDYLCELAGIECDVITSSSINHAWNIVTISGEKYYVDCTWDDPIGDGAWTDVYCAHTNFLRTQQGMIETGHDGAKDWKDTTGALVFDKPGYGTSTTYEGAYWNGVETAIPQIGSVAAYVYKAKDPGSETTTIYKHDYAANPAPTGAGDAALVENFPARWYADWTGEGDYWTDHYNSLTTNGGVFAASTPDEIHFITVDGADTVAFRLDEFERTVGWIYGIMYDDKETGCIYYLRRKGGDKAPQEDTIAMEAVTPPSKRGIDDKTITTTPSDDSFEYTGKPQQPSVDVKEGERPLVEGTDYSVTVIDSDGKPTESPVDAGTYTVRLDGIDPYAGEREAVTYSIDKAENSFTGVKAKISKAVKRKKILKKAKSLALPKLTAAFGADTAKWQVVKKDKRNVLKLKNGKVVVKKKAKKGTYTIKLKATIPGTDNYYAASTKTIAFKVKVK